MGVAYQQRAKSHLRGQTHGCMLITAVVVGCTGQLDLGASAELNGTASVSGGESEIMLPHDYPQDRSATTIEVQCQGRSQGDATACECAIPGEWTKLQIWVSQAHFGATRVEGGDSFSATLRHTHPNYHYPTCLHCPNGVVTGGTGEHRCREATNELGRLCPYEIHSAATDGRASEDAEITVINSYNNGVYYVSYMTTIPGLYDLEIQLDGAHVRGSPFAVEIANGESQFWTSPWQWWGNGQVRGNGFLDPSPSQVVVAAGVFIACMTMPWCYMGFRARRLRKIASVNVAPVASRSVVCRKYTQR